jgi:hypothetical protein
MSPFVRRGDIIKCREILQFTVLWQINVTKSHMKLFNIEHKHWTLFRKMHASIPDKIQQEIISKVGDIFIFYHIDLIDMMDFKNSIWQLIPTSLHCMSIVDLTIYISQ